CEGDRHVVDPTLEVSGRRITVLLRLHKHHDLLAEPERGVSITVSRDPHDTAIVIAEPDVPLLLPTCWDDEVHELPPTARKAADEILQVQLTDADHRALARLDEGARAFTITNPPAERCVMNADRFCGLSERERF